MEVKNAQAMARQIQENDALQKMLATKMEALMK
jgi:hypothetical protein